MSCRVSGGRIDRAAPLRFTVDGVVHTGFRGDTLASALLGTGVLQVGASPYLGRPRGIVAAGVEEPNALVQLGGPEPMLLATREDWSTGWWRRSLRGQGRLTDRTGPGGYDAKHEHCDVLVVGADPAGLIAA